MVRTENGRSKPAPTEVPAVMGIWMSKTMILAVNDDVRGTISPGRQSTLPMFSEIGSTPVRVRLTFEPAPAHRRPSPSLSIAVHSCDQRSIPRALCAHSLLTFYNCRLIPGDNPETFTSDDDPTTHSSRHRDTRRRSLEHVRDWEPQKRIDVSRWGIESIWNTISHVSELLATTKWDADPIDRPVLDPCTIYTMGSWLARDATS